MSYFDIYRAPRGFHKKRKRWASLYEDMINLCIINYKKRVEGDGGIVEAIYCADNKVSYLKMK